MALSKLTANEAEWAALQGAAEKLLTENRTSFIAARDYCSTQMMIAQDDGIMTRMMDLSGAEHRQNAARAEADKAVRDYESSIGRRADLKDIFLAKLRKAATDKDYSDFNEMQAWFEKSTHDAAMLGNHLRSKFRKERETAFKEAIGNAEEFQDTVKHMLLLWDLL